MMNKIFGGCLILFFAFQASGQQSKPIQFREELYDFGNIAENGGPAVHEFVFTNASGRPIKILSVQASCGCTTPDWSKNTIAPGATGFIQANFNPKGRPGYFNKTLTVTTDFEPTSIILQIKGQVISAENKPAVTEFQSAHGNLKFKTSSFNLGKIYLKDEFVVREFTFVNGGDKPITYLDKFTGPKYVRLEVKPKTVKPGEQGIVRLGYNGKLKNQYGFQTDNVELVTDDALEPIKSFSIYATLEDYFPPLTNEELSKAPELTLGVKTIDFGRVKQNMPTVRELQFTNTGRRELIIRSIQGNCTCIAAAAIKSTVKPGEGSSIQITFNPQDRQGSQTKAITIYSNDPEHPVQRVTFTAYVD